jgi:ribosomal protein S15P/S13E
MLPNYALTEKKQLELYIATVKTDFGKLEFHLTYVKNNKDKDNSRILTEIDTQRDILLSFVTRQEYLDWVAHWKSNYKALAKNQRETKARGARSEVMYNKGALRAMLYLRAEGKRKSWELKKKSM